ncbi:MAG: hypothetical protein ABIN35_00480 [candidate division WOR-3 bacterium]
MDSKIVNISYDDVLKSMQQQNPPNVLNDQLNPANASMDNFQHLNPSGTVMGSKITEQDQLKAIQQQFMSIIQNNKDLQQQFADPVTLEKSLQDTSLMIKYINEYNLNLKSVGLPNKISPEPTNYSGTKEGNNEISQQDEIDDEGESMINDQSTFQKFCGILQEPLIMTLIFAILIQPFIRQLLIQIMPRIQTHTFVQNLILISIFMIIAIMIKIIGTYLGSNRQG